MESETISWELAEEVEKGFELEHGCGIFFDLFHDCSCTNNIKRLIIIIMMITISFSYFLFLC